MESHRLKLLGSCLYDTERAYGLDSGASKITSTRNRTWLLGRVIYIPPTSSLVRIFIFIFFLTEWSLGPGLSVAEVLWETYIHVVDWFSLQGKD